MRHRRGGGGTGAGAVYAAGRALGWGRPRRVMAGTLALVLGLASLSFVMRATGSLLPNLPPAITARTSGLAPALLAALVAIQLTGTNGLLHLDVKVPAVLFAALLAALRAPFIVCVIAGALVAALLRAVFHL